MNLFLVVLCALVIMGLAAHCIYQFVKVPLKEKAMLPVVLAVLVCLLGEAMFLFSARLPYLTDRMTANSIQQLEDYLNTVSSDYIDQEIDVADVRTVLSAGERLNAYTEGNREIGLLVKVIGLETYTKGLSSLCQNADGVLQEFEAQGIAFTPHNLLMYTHDSAMRTVRDISKKLGVIVLLVTIFLFGMVYLLYYALLKGWIDVAPGVVFGDENN